MRTLIAIAALLACAAPARAFHGQADYKKRAIEGGGEGMYYSGSPRSRGYDCTACHIDPEGRIGFAMGSEPPGLLEGAYVPDTTYAITLLLRREHRGLGAPLNANTFVFEVVDGEAAQAGLFGGLGQNVERPASEELVVARGEYDSQTEWTFEWVAPPPGAGTLHLFLAGVDGDGAEGRLGRTGDPFGDDVFTAELTLAEMGSAPERRMVVGAPTCGVTGRPTSAAPPWVVVALLVLVVARLARHR